MVKIEKVGWREILYFVLVMSMAIFSIYIYDGDDPYGFSMLFFSACAILSYSFFRFTDWIEAGSKIGSEKKKKHEEPTQINVTHIRVALNVLDVEPGFGKRELKRARKLKLATVKQEKKQIGFFDKAGKIENKNKVERIEQSYKNLLEHVK